MNGLLTFSKWFEGHQQNASGANIMSRSWNSEQLGFMTDTFYTVSQLLATIKRTLCSFKTAP